MIHGFIRPQLVRLGKIRLGERTRNASGKEFPNDLDHFLVPDEVAAVYGDKPQALDVRVPSADIEQWFPFALKRYSRDGKLWCKGDGQLARCFDESTGEWSEVVCAYKDCPHYAGRKCTEIGVLQVILPQVDLSGVYQIATGSWHGINNVYGEFNTFLSIMRAAIGPVADQAVLHVTFQLTREKTTIEYQGTDGKRNSREKYLLHLRAPRMTLQMMEDLRRQCTVSVAGYLTPGATTDDVPPDYDANTPIEGVVLPDPDEDMPADQYPNATPAGPDMGQRTAWAALLEQVQSLGKDIVAAEKSAISIVTREAKVFTDLTSDEATRAIDNLTNMIQSWQNTAAIASTSGKTSKAPATSAAAKAGGNEELSF